MNYFTEIATWILKRTFIAYHCVPSLRSPSSLGILRWGNASDQKLEVGKLRSLASYYTLTSTDDHTNYVRWGPVYLAGMENLETKAPKVHVEFIAGNFVVKRTNKRFNQVLADQATEWMNKTCKVQNGIIGITRNDQARDKFCVTWPERSRILQGTRCLFSLEDDEEAITLFCPLGQPPVTKETRY